MTVYWLIIQWQTYEGLLISLDSSNGAYSHAFCVTLMHFEADLVAFYFDWLFFFAINISRFAKYLADASWKLDSPIPGPLLHNLDFLRTASCEVKLGNKNPTPLKDKKQFNQRHEAECGEQVHVLAKCRKILFFLFLP